MASISPGTRHQLCLARGILICIGQIIRPFSAQHSSAVWIGCTISLAQVAQNPAPEHVSHLMFFFTSPSSLSLSLPLIVIELAWAFLVSKVARKPKFAGRSHFLRFPLLSVMWSALGGGGGLHTNILLRAAALHSCNCWMSLDLILKWITGLPPFRLWIFSFGKFFKKSTSFLIVHVLIIECVFVEGVNFHYGTLSVCSQSVVLGQWLEVL